MTTIWQQLSLNNDYALMSDFYQKAINLNPNLTVNYFYLGLSLLLQNKQEESKTIWNLGLQRSDSKNLSIQELTNILEDEASRQEELSEYHLAWNIRQNIRQIVPNEYINSTKICILSLHLQTFDPELLKELGFVNPSASEQESNDDSLLKFLVIYAGSYIVKSPLLLKECLKLISACLPYFRNKEACLQALILVASKYEIDTSLKFIDVFLAIYPNYKSVELLSFLASRYLINHEYDKAIQIARESILECSQNIYQKTASTYALLYALIERGGNWQKLETTFKELRSLHSQLATQELENISNSDVYAISVTPFFAPYFEDVPQFNHVLQNQILQLFCSGVQSSLPDITRDFQMQNTVRTIQKNQKIKIGYLVTSLRQHSVGWLARSLFQHFDRDSFEVYGYFPAYNLGGDFLEEWYISRMDFVFRQGVEYFSDRASVLAKQINNDKIDILVDIESLTSPISLGVLATKPAPIQVSWLGWDASGLPTMDYYIADPHVLPESAQEYYSEKIWRLPHTYIGTDGFECATITLHRCDLGIPNDAIIYFCSQKSCKRHPDNVKAQLQIIQQVPNSYLLIKGLADEKYIQTFFYELAELEGVAKERLIFLPYADSEADHRANMAIADVVLDTYPYNGATTTMETLWMGIPMVTQVGEQFAARNSYTMMMNVGVTEGIAHNVEEYIEWGVRFGTDEFLRRDVAWKLRQSRQTSPLWDGRQFAREMENAYRQMWEIYNEQS